MNARTMAMVYVLGAAVAFLDASAAFGDVFNMGPALTSLETVFVGNPGNAADTRYNSIAVGAVAYTYNIGKYEVTAGQYAEFLNSVAKADPYGLYSTDMDTANSQYGCNIKRAGTPGSYTYSVAADWANRPVHCVSWADAARFANWLHNGQAPGPQDTTTTETGVYDLVATQRYYGPDGHTPVRYSDEWWELNDALLAVTREAGWTYAIPTENEWYKAAHDKNEGPEGGFFDFPTGSSEVPNCIRDGQLIPVPDPGNYATYNGDHGDLGIGSPYYRTEVGEHESSASPYGTYDQGGNVWEWTEAVVGLGRGVRGGSFLQESPSLHASNRNGDMTLTEDNFVGFRVIQVPEPATLVLLALGGLEILGRRWPSAR